MPQAGHKSDFLSGFLRYNLWGILWGLLIILLTVVPGRVFPTLPTFLDLFQPDKLVHVFIFTIYFFLQARGLTLQDRYPSIQRNANLITYLIGFTLAALTEIVQEYIVPMRDGNIYDFIADVAGCLLGWLAFKVFSHVKRKIRQG